MDLNLLWGLYFLRFMMSLSVVIQPVAAEVCARFCENGKSALGPGCVCAEDGYYQQLLGSDATRVKRSSDILYNALLKHKRINKLRNDDADAAHQMQRRIFRWGKKRAARGVDDVTKLEKDLSNEYVAVVSHDEMRKRDPMYGDSNTAQLLQLQDAIQSGEMDYYDLLSESDSDLAKRKNSNFQNPIFKWGKRSIDDVTTADKRDRHDTFNPVFKWGKRDISESDSYESEKRSRQDMLNPVFKWGKKSYAGGENFNPVFKWGKREEIASDSDKRSSGQAMLNPVFKWGKRAEFEETDQEKRSQQQMLNPVFKWGKKDHSKKSHLKKRSAREDMLNPVFKWGKRNPQSALNPIFKWGKRVDDDYIMAENAIKKNHEMLNPVFKWGKREDELKRGHEMLNPVFKWGKRMDTNLYNNKKSASALNPIFKWGKRASYNYDIRRSQMNPIFKWGKRGGQEKENIFEGVKRGSSALANPIFKWGKKSSAEALNPIFKWGKKSTEEAFNPIFKWGKKGYNDFQVTNSLEDQWEPMYNNQPQYSRSGNQPKTYKRDSHPLFHQQPHDIMKEKDKKAPMQTIFKWGKRTIPLESWV